MAASIVLAASGVSGGQDPVREADEGPAGLELSIVLERTSARLRRSVAHLQGLAWTTTVRYEVLDGDGRAIETGEPGEVVYKTTVSPFSFPDSSVVVPITQVELMRVDGEPVDSDHELPWHYPKPAVPVPTFLIGVDEGYSFSLAGRGEARGRDAIMLDFVWRPEDRRVRVVRGQQEYLLSVAGVSHAGRVWIDAESSDVLRVERHSGPVEIVEGRSEQATWSYERQWTASFQLRRFENPEQALLVPESAEVATFLAGESPAVRRMVTTHGDFRRFVADVEITPLDE